jgi:hypothetical protein
MSARSQLVRGVVAISIACAGYPCFGYEYIEKLHSTETAHGLYEVREAARKFVAEENAREKSNWVALDPNLKAQVTKCDVPLRAKWAPKSAGMAGNNVLVYCTKTIRGSAASEQWTLAVPVDQTSK